MRIRSGMPWFACLLIVASLLSSAARPGSLAAAPEPQSSPLLCGELVTDYFDAGMTAYMYTVLVTCSGERILWQPTSPGEGSCTGLCRIEGAVLVPDDLTLRGGTVTQKLIAFSRVETIPDCGSCVPPPPSETPPPPPPTDTPPPPPTDTPPPPPTNTPLPPPTDTQPPPVPTNTQPPASTDTPMPAATDTVPPPRATDTTQPPAPEITERPPAPAANVVLADVSIKLKTGARLGAEADLTQILAFEESLTATALRTTTLWLKVTNNGQATFEPPVDGGHYTVQVSLTSQGGTTSLGTFSSREDNLIPLYRLSPGRSALGGPITLRISNTPLAQGILTVSFVPDSGLGMQGSRISKAITIIDFSEYDPADCLVVSLTAILKPLAGDLSESLPGKLLELVTDITTMCQRDDWLCVLQQFAEWVVKLLLELGKDIGKTFSLLIEIYEMVVEQEQMYQTMGEKGCWEAAAWFNALTGELNKQGRPAHGILSQSPVYPLAVDSSGRRAGFDAGGQNIAEIPGARAGEIGEERIILLPGTEPIQVEIRGYGEGTVDLHTVFAGDSGATIASYEDVPATPGMRASVASEDDQHVLHIDTNGDGKVDQTRLPDRLERVKAQSRVSGEEGLLLGIIGFAALIAICAAVLILILLRPRLAVPMTAAGGAISRPGRTPGPVPGLPATGKPATQEQRAKGRCRLVDRANPERWYPVTTSMAVGRSRDNGLVLDHITISRRHARIQMHGGEVWLLDMGSTNGTYVNDRPVREACRLANGDIVRFGALELIFRQ